MFLLIAKPPCTAFHLNFVVSIVHQVLGRMCLYFYAIHFDQSDNTFFNWLAGISFPSHLSLIAGMIILCWLARIRLFPV